MKRTVTRRPGWLVPALMALSLGVAAQTAQQVPQDPVADAAEASPRQTGQGSGQLPDQRAAQNPAQPAAAQRQADQQGSGPPARRGGAMAGPPARLGVAVQAMPFAELENHGLDHGVVVRNVMDGGPAEVAGIRPGDVIVELDGQAAYSPARLSWLLSRADDPSAVSLRIRRGGEAQVITADVTRMRDGATGRAAPGRVTQQAFLGIRMQPLDIGRGEDLGVDDGVLVADVIADSPAADAGLQSGDVIVELAGRTVDGLEDIHRAMDYFDPGERIALQVLRDGETQALDVELGGVAPSRFHGRYPPQAPFQNWRDWSHPWMQPWHNAPLPPTGSGGYSGDPHPRDLPPNW